jgi:AcrR family transcriptional regulator
MSPRPRVSSDQDLLAATQRAVSRLGPNLTLGDVAREAGVSAASLVQRFGSKRALLLAFVSSASGATSAQFAQIRAARPDPLDALREVVRCYAMMAPTPEAVSNALAFLQVDLSDPEFHTHAHTQAKDTIRELRRLLDAAVAAKQLRPTDTRRLARALHAIIGGSMVAWGVLREGTAEKWMLDDVDTLLAPYHAAGRTRPRTRGRRVSQPTVGAGRGGR